MSSDDPQVSVIVPSFNSRTTIGPCLRSLHEQDVGVPFEILVVDSSDDGTDALVAEEYPDVQLVHLPTRTLPGPARNIAIRAARGKILAFTDSDCVVDSTWISDMLRRHASGSFAAVGGSVMNGRPRSAVGWSGLLVEFNEFLSRSPERLVELLPTCNVSYTREVFERHGLFPEDLWPSEDHIFSFRLAEAGEKLLFDPSICVRHLFRPTIAAFVRHQHRLGAASAQARRSVALPHSWLAESPLRWFTPLMRLARIETRLAGRDLPNFLRFNLLLPLTMTGLLAWGIGFANGEVDMPSPAQHD